MYQIRDFIPRQYQEAIFHTAVKANTLICLPTGRGKTKTALMIAVQRLNQIPNSKIIFLTPTKPLAAQIVKEFKENSTIQNINLFTGEIKPEKREILFKESEVIVSTPQGMSNDIINKKIDLTLVSAIIFDECHRAVGEYDYVWIAKQYNKTINSRIIAMSASPGSNLEKIKEVCENLYIENIEVRTDQDKDVKPYVKSTKTNYVEIELPDSFKQVLNYFERCHKQKLSILKDFGLCTTTNNISKKVILGMQRELQARIAQGEKTPEIWKMISLVAQVLKVQHAQELFETQGIKSAKEYMHRLFKEAPSTKVKATKNLVIDPEFKAAYYKITTMYELGEIHPKIKKIKEIIDKEIKNCEKILIFSNFRDSAKRIKEEIDQIEQVSSTLFVGQTKKRGTGLSQKEQIKVLQDFKEGKFNVVIGTSVGEEGIDIPAVDLIIFYEPVPSAIRTVQRRGRTGRMKEGRVQVLVAKGTRDEAYRWSAYHKENRMHKVLKELKSNLIFDKPKNKKLSHFQEEPKIKIFADARERGSGVIKILVDNNTDVSMKNMEVGDFILSQQVGVERKEVKDFVDSIIDKRILGQLQSLKKTFEKSLLIIEGEEDIYSVRKVHPNAIRGMLSWIAVDLRIPILYTKNHRETAQLLMTIAKREQEDNEKVFGIRGEKKPLSDRELQEFIIVGLPGIGPSLAKSMLNKFETIENIIKASQEELTKIDKIGIKKASEIKRIIKEKYKD
jgi:ERCC4-related helicase